MLKRPWFAACLCLMTAPMAAHAQGPFGHVLPEVAAEAPRVERTGAMRRYRADVRVLTVESPARAGEVWHYRVTLVPGARLIGPAEGSAPAMHPVTVSIQLSEELPAGVQHVGVVQFSLGTKTVERTLGVQVATRRQLDVSALRALRTATPGETLALTYMLSNRGNATDSLHLQLDAPSGWQAVLSGPALVVLPANGIATVTVRVRTPMTLAAGSGLVTLRAEYAAASQSASVLVEVGASATGTRRGPALTIGAAAIGSEAWSMRSVYSLMMRGPVSERLSIDATLASRLDGDPLALRAASQLGAPVGGSYVRLSGTRGFIEAGRVSQRLPELAGLAVGGDGVAAEWRVADGSRFEAAAVRQAVLSGAGGRQLATQWTSRPASLTWRVGLSSLDESQSTGRRLSALAVGGRWAPTRRSSLSVEVAEREFAGGRGIGVATEAAWDRDRTRGRVRAFHAPGGSAAFAMARTGVLGESQFQFSPQWQATAQAWVMGDLAFDGSMLRTSGGALAPMRRVGSHGDIGASVSFVQYRTGAGHARRQDTQMEFIARSGFTAGALRWDAEAGIERSVHGVSVRADDGESSARRIARSTLGWYTRLGTLSVRGSFRTASAYLASEGSVDVQVSALRPIPALPALTVDGGVQRVYLNRSAVSSAHAVIGYALPGGLRVLAGAQRDALFAMGSTRPSTVYSLRIERSSAAPGFARLMQRAGIVFLDVNDNGVRDSGEPGVPGVIVRAGAQRVTTDRHGRYALPAEHAVAAIDVRSLADGQRVGVPAQEGSRDIPIRVTARLDVRIRRDATFGRQASIPVTIIVTARDAAGREWIVSADATGCAHFDALPPGVYSVNAASDNENAPLRVDPVTVRIDASFAQPQSVELVSRGRPIRMQGVSSANAGLTELSDKNGSPRPRQ